MKKKTKKIGEILLERGFITKDILDEALRQQVVSGGVMTQYLLSNKYIKEEDLAKCVSDQFGFPHICLANYDVPYKIAHLISADIAQKYLLVPIDKLENIITVVMVDPLDNDAIEHVERLTGCKIQPFVGIISDVITAIKRYYKVNIMGNAFGERCPVLLSATSDGYNGPERRRSIRINSVIDVHFPIQDFYKNSKTKNISLHGVLFESDNALPLNSYVTLQIELPKEISHTPIAAVVKTVRVVMIAPNKFDIGAEIVKISEEEIHLINKYAAANNTN